MNYFAALIILFVAAGFLRAETETSSLFDRWLDELGSASYKARNAAERKLLAEIESNIFTYQKNHFHKMKTTDGWHHYRIEVQGDDLNIYVDNKQVIQAKWGSFSHPKAESRVAFGDSTSSAGSRAKIRNVRFIVFERDEKE